MTICHNIIHNLLSIYSLYRDLEDNPGKIEYRIVREGTKIKDKLKLKEVNEGKKRERSSILSREADNVTY